MSDIQSTKTMAGWSRGILVAALAVFSLTLAGACSDDGGETGEGDECETASDCSGDLRCLDGVCSPLDGNNNNTPDGGGPDGGGNNQAIEPEDYYVSYVFHDKDSDAYSLRVYSTADDTHTQVSPDGVSCESHCWLSEDMSHFVWAERNADNSSNRDVYRASVEDLEAQDDGEVIASDVSGVKVVGDVVTYQRNNDGQYAAYFMPLDSGEETTLGSLGSSQSTLNGWHVDPDSDMGVIFSPEPQVLRLKIGDLGETISETTYTLSAENYQEISGGYFGSSMPVEISADGKLMAFVTEAPNNYGACDVASDCSGPVQRCGRFGQCTAIEVTAHIVDMENLSALGESCGGPGTCEGDIHECYSPDESNTDDAVCIPARVAVGLPDQPAQRATPQDQPAEGCELSSGHDDYHYTSLRGPLSFDASGKLYVVGSRDCNTVGDSDVLQIDPVDKTYEVVWGNPDDEGGYDGDLCFDYDTSEPDDAECVPYINSAMLSPEGKELAMQATNPWVGDPSRATDNMGLWTVLRDGEEQAWAGGQELRETIEPIAVHPAP
ncbi:MAG: hypothetical protein ACLFVJ_13555 [Persicimonas sp.]